MAQISPEDELDQELIADYRDSFVDHYEIIINCIATLELTPDNDASIDELFRSLHSIKGNARMLMFEQLAFYIHAIEEGLSALREHKIQFTELMGEAITLSLDKAKEFSEDFLTRSITENPSMNVIQEIFTQLHSASQDDVDSLCAKIVKEITGFEIDLTAICNQSEVDSILIDINDSTKQNKAPETFLFHTEMAHEMFHYISEDTPDNLKEHLGYMRYLALLLEAKIPHWQGRIFLANDLLLRFNKALDYKIANHQLEMAVYAHDIAFAFLPDNLMKTREKFTPEEHKLMQTHAQMGADFIGINNKWQIAHEIVLQHHEKSNGNGYPGGLKEEQICLGAKMLSIVDAFIAMTAYRPDRAYKRSVLTALNEIKNQAGKQFSAELVPVFLNMLVKSLK